MKLLLTALQAEKDLEEREIVHPYSNIGETFHINVLGCPLGHREQLHKAPE